MSVHKQGLEIQSSSGRNEDDLDMRRATDLVELHYGVKMKHKRGDDKDLQQARRDVDDVLKEAQDKNANPRQKPG